MSENQMPFQWASARHLSGGPTPKGVNVVPLAWSPETPPDGTCSYDHSTAETPLQKVSACVRPPNASESLDAAWASLPPDTWVALHRAQGAHLSLDPRHRYTAEIGYKGNWRTGEHEADTPAAALLAAINATARFLVPAKPIDVDIDAPMTMDELFDAFGGTIPMEVCGLIFDSPETKTVGEVRRGVRRMMERRAAGLPLLESQP